MIQEQLAEQTTTAEEIRTLRRNYNKDGETRKTKTYLEKKISELKRIYEIYRKRDLQLKDSKDIIENHPYLTERTEVQTTYDVFIVELREKLNNIPLYHPLPELRGETSLSKSTEIHSQSTTESAAENSSRTMTGFETTNNYKLQKLRMIRMYKEIDSANQILNSSVTMGAIKLAHCNIQKLMEQITTLHDQLYLDATFEEQTTIKYFVDEYYDNLVREHDKVMISLITALEKPTQGGGSQQEYKQQLRLPNIEIPKFSGDYTKWGSFRDLFLRVIHTNNELQNVTKIAHLKSIVIGGAAKLISHLEPIGENYETAWKLLTDRYENKRLLAFTYLHTMVNQPTLHQESAQQLKEMHDTTKELLHALNNLKIGELADAIILYIMLRKLDPETSKLYEMQLLNAKELETTDDLLKFIEHRFQSLEALKRPGLLKNHEQRFTTGNKGPVKNIHTTTTSRCRHCASIRHEIEDCPQFKAIASAERTQLALLLNLCRICLKEHKTSSCKSNKGCNNCGGNHHTLLHLQPVNKVPKKSTSMQTNLVEYTEQQQTLLGTALVEAVGEDSKSTLLRVLIDSGSQGTFISKKAANLLNLKKKKTHIKIAGMGGLAAGVCNHTASLKLLPTLSNEFCLTIEAMIFNQLTQKLPDFDIDTTRWSHLKHLQLADPTFNRSNTIDILLGADYYPMIIKEGIVKRGENEPVAQLTEFGWIIIGKTGNNLVSKLSTRSMVTTTAIEEQLKLFIENDAIPEERAKTEEEIVAENKYKSSVQRSEDGKYIVKLPLKNDCMKLGESRKRAAARLQQIERRFTRDENFKQLYHNFIKEYIELQHMQPLSEIDKQSNTGNSYYIPHHGVINENSSTTKLRVVFDASAKTSTGESLNDNMLNGPKLQDDLADIIIRWRKHKYVITADIEKMFRQIHLHQDHQNYQRILWREKPELPMSEYKLKTVTYGTTAANFLAVRTLQQLAEDEKQKYPVAANILITDFYVDDLLTGRDEIHDLIAAQQELNELTNKGGFPLRKWSSNSNEVMKHIPKELHATGKVEFKLNDVIKTLGIIYNPTDDNFEFDTETLQLSNKRATKRSLLSDSSKLFDPIGWLSPITVTAKILMQKTWESAIGWDDVLPDILDESWIKYNKQISVIKEIKIPRWVGITEKDRTELHGFADASEYAYAAAIYCKTFDIIGKPMTQLLIAKTRVAPIKTKLTIPRLELNAALLLAKLMKHVQTAMKLQEVIIYAWSDSTITLSWIKGDPSRFKTFVSNRVSKIKQLIPPSCWHHVKTQENPADIASRGIEPNQLVNNRLWWNGPLFLEDDTAHWSSVNISNLYPEELELKKVTALNTYKSVHPYQKLFKTISKLGKLLRVISYTQRFIRNCKKIHIPKTKTINCEEIREAKQLAVTVMQDEEFLEDIMVLRKTKQLHKKSKLLSLNAFLDEKEVLRVGGRMKNSTLPFNQKHPIILSGSHPLTTLIIEDVHRTSLHGGISLTLAVIRQQYWIINGRSVVRSALHKCVTCCRYRKDNLKQIMAALPKERVTQSYPFEITGVDYAGPIKIRASSSRSRTTYKGYIAIFVCFATKGCHIEIVSDLTTNAFLAALKRFMARRGISREIYSDNGTTFVGANKQLTTMFQKTLENKLTEFTAMQGIKWHFIPPGAPHFGGLWEAGVKSAKYHLKRVIGETTLTYEELATLSCQIEACLNSRPLTRTTSDIDEQLILTPAHFLIGKSLLSHPEESLLGTKQNRLSRWNLLQQMNQDFWKRWHNDYLNSLQQRFKWKSAQPNLVENQIVLIKDSNAPPCAWPMGRIVETHRGDDHKIRVVSIKHKGGTTKLPITKLCLLPIDPDESKKQQHTTVTTNDEQPISQRRTSERLRSKRLVVNHMCWKWPYMILAVCGLLSQTTSITSPAVQITKFNYTPGIFFEELGTIQFNANKWTLILSYNLTDYWQEMEHIHIGYNMLLQLCSQQGETISICSMLTKQLNHRIKIIDSQNNRLREKQPTRTRRGLIDGIGIVANKLFGVLDVDDAKEFHSHIKELSSRQDYEVELIKNQTLIIDATVNALRHNIGKTAKQLETFNDHLAFLEDKINQQVADSNHFNKALTINMLSLQLTLLLADIETSQRCLLQIIMHSNQEEVYPHILSEEQFSATFNKITLNLPGTLQIPDEIMHRNFQHIEARAYTLGKMIIIRIIIPVIQRKVYNLHHLIPVPSQHNQHLILIEPSSEYLAADSEKKQYIPFSSENLRQCTVMTNNKYRCDSRIVYSRESNVSLCEISLLQHKDDSFNNCILKTLKKSDVWIKLRQPNKWIFVLMKERTLDLICDKTKGEITLEGEGVITLRKSCIVHDQNIMLIPSINMTTTSLAAYQPRYNISWAVEQNPELISKWTDQRSDFKSSEQEEISKIIKDISVQKINELQMSSKNKTLLEDHHHLGLIYSIISIIIVYTIIVNIRKVCNKKQQLREPLSGAG